MKNKKKASADSSFFWKTAKEYTSHILPKIRNASPNTVKSYREGINKYIDYLEEVKHVDRTGLSFEEFSRDNITSYLDWMLNIKKYAAKTCNLRITAINGLLEYAANEDSINIMAIYQDVRTVRGPKIQEGPIEYFESFQMKALLSIPDTMTRTGRRNQMMLILYYDTAARISELLEMTMKQIHLDAETPYLTILGKGRKYRNIPLMDKTVCHLKRYIKEFHTEYRPEDPLFYAKAHGDIHALSPDTVETMIKKYSIACAKKGTSMPDHPHCHMIRKTRSMDLYKNGMPLSHIQQMLGHESISTTSGFYAFATVETLAKSLKKANKEENSEGKKWDNKEVLKKIYSL